MKKLHIVVLIGAIIVSFVAGVAVRFIYSEVRPLNDTDVEKIQLQMVEFKKFIDPMEGDISYLVQLELYNGSDLDIVQNTTYASFSNPHGDDLLYECTGNQCNITPGSTISLSACIEGKLYNENYIDMNRFFIRIEGYLGEVNAEHHFYYSHGFTTDSIKTDGTLKTPADYEAEYTATEKWRVVIDAKTNFYIPESAYEELNNILYANNGEPVEYQTESICENYSFSYGEDGFTVWLAQNKIEAKRDGRYYICDISQEQRDFLEKLVEKIS